MMLRVGEEYSSDCKGWGQLYTWLLHVYRRACALRKTRVVRRRTICVLHSTVIHTGQIKWAKVRNHCTTQSSGTTSSISCSTFSKKHSLWVPITGVNSLAGFVNGPKQTPVLLVTLSPCVMNSTSLRMRPATLPAYHLLDVRRKLPSRFRPSLPPTTFPTSVKRSS